MRDFDQERQIREVMMVSAGIHPNAARIGEVVLYVSHDIDGKPEKPTLGVVTSLSGNDGSNGALIITPVMQMGVEKLALLGGTQGPKDILEVYDRWTIDRICTAVKRGCGYDGFFNRETVDEIVEDRKAHLLPFVPDDPAHNTQ